MDSGWGQEMLAWISQNPGWSTLIIFLIAFIESLLIIGILIPGILFLFAIGALVGLGQIEMWPVWVAGSAGAIAGDLLSFWIGRRYQRRLRHMWPFSRFPGMLRRGADYFRAHGAKSVVAGRFIGPLRPIIPVTAGMLGMSPQRFTAICIPAGIAWSPSYLLPGMLFGASLEVAAEYAGRLAMMLVVVVGFIWLSLWLIRLLYEVLASRSARWLRHAIRWQRRHPVMGRITGPILDPSQPEVLSVTMLGLLLLVAFWAFLLLLFLSPFGAEPGVRDLAVLEWTRTLRNDIADPFMVVVSQVSRWWVLIPTSAATLLWLLGAGRKTAAIHWLVAMFGGAVLQLLSAWTLRATPLLSLSGNDTMYAPSPALTMTTVVLGFFSVMVAKELRRQHRKWPYLISGALLSLLLFARIYLGLEWLSGALLGLVLGFAWTAIVGIAYRQRALRGFSGQVACGIFYGTLAIMLALVGQQRMAGDLEAVRLPLPVLELQSAEWWTDDWAALPTERNRSHSVASRRFNLQAGLPVLELERLLAEDGWERPAPQDWELRLQALSPNPDAHSLPLTGKNYYGRREALVMRRQGSAPETQLVLRLWESGAQLQPGGQALYLGQIGEEVMTRRLVYFSYWRARRPDPGLLEDFGASLKSPIEATLKPGPVLLLRATKGE